MFKSTENPRKYYINYGDPISAALRSAIKKTGQIRQAVLTDTKSCMRQERATTTYRGNFYFKISIRNKIVINLGRAAKRNAGGKNTIS